MTVGFIGAGSWGTTLAVHLARLGHDILLWGHGAEQRDRMRRDRENRVYLPAIAFPDSIQLVDTPRDAANAEMVVIATPTQYIRETLATVAPRELDNAIVVSVSKGIEQSTLLRVSEVLADTHGVDRRRFVALSGPSHAEEVAKDIPTLIVAASPSLDVAQRVQALFTTDSLRVYRTQDLIGVELGASLKNVIAVAAGIIDGLGMGDNTKAALITRGLAEITRMGTALGADAHTFSGLSGLGDLVVTCTSRHSRNRFVGEQVGRGRPLQNVIDEMSMIAEGVTTCDSAHRLSQAVGTETPIIERVYRVLFENVRPREAIFDLMTRETKQEIWT